MSKNLGEDLKIGSVWSGLTIGSTSDVLFHRVVTGIDRIYKRVSYIALDGRQAGCTGSCNFNTWENWSFLTVPHKQLSEEQLRYIPLTLKDPSSSMKKLPDDDELWDDEDTDERAKPTNGSLVVHFPKADVGFVPFEKTNLGDVIICLNGSAGLIIEDEDGDKVMVNLRTFRVRADTYEDDLALVKIVSAELTVDES